MKYLLILFFAINAYGYSIQEIESWTLEDKILEIAYRLNPDCKWKLKKKSIELEESNYDALESKKCIKPLYSVFVTEFSNFKAEEIQKENDRIAEKERQKGLTKRVHDLYKKDAGMPSFYRIKSNESSWQAYVYPMIKDKKRKEEAETFITELEKEHKKFEEEQEIVKQKKDQCKLYIEAFNSKSETDFMLLSESQKSLMLQRVLKCR